VVRSSPNFDDCPARHRRVCRGGGRGRDRSQHPAGRLTLQLRPPVVRAKVPRRNRRTPHGRPSVRPRTPLSDANDAGRLSAPVGEPAGSLGKWPSATPVRLKRRDARVLLGSPAMPHAAQAPDAGYRALDTQLVSRSLALWPNCAKIGRVIATRRVAAERSALIGRCH
jgi:hypothetical protein